MDTVEIEFNSGYENIDRYTKAMQFALVSDDNKQVSTFYVCRDYLSEVIQASYLGVAKTIAGTEYIPGANPAREKLKMMMTYPGATDIEAKIEKLQQFLHQAEEKLEFEPTQIFRVKSKTKSPIFLFVGDASWISAPPMLSMYTLFMRVGINHENGDFRNTLQQIADKAIAISNYDDVQYVKDSERAFRWAFDEVNPKVIFTDVKYNWTVGVPDTGWYMHCNAGIVSWSKKTSKKIWPKWYENFNKAKKAKHANAIEE